MCSNKFPVTVSLCLFSGYSLPQPLPPDPGAGGPVQQGAGETGETEGETGKLGAGAGHGTESGGKGGGKGIGTGEEEDAPLLL